jgi:three-Cys-motif partner protein
MIEKLPNLEDDGLITPEVGAWAEYKYRLVWNYAKMFSSSMKNKWDARVYIDLFAGAGRSKIENSKQIVAASPLLALDIPHPFDKYIFCDNETDKRQALEQRVKRDHQNANVAFVEEANTHVAAILEAIPKHSSTYRVLSFCFADPYKLKNLRFSTIKRLSEKYMDFLILLPTYMDAHRNLVYYIESSNTVIEDFTGSQVWRADWKLAEARGQEFGLFIADLFGKQMKDLKYIYTGLSDMIPVRSTDKNLPLYHLAFFSRNEKGAAFWKETKKYSTDQISMFE